MMCFVKLDPETDLNYISQLHHNTSRSQISLKYAEGKKFTGHS